MGLVMVYVILYNIKCIQACRSGLKMDLGDGKDSFLDYKNWKLPPDNADWWGFVNLLGTRDTTEKVTTVSTTPDTDVEHERGFPWIGLGFGESSFNPPPESRIKSYIGQSPACLYPPVRGNGSLWYLRWYYDAREDRCKRFVYSGSGGNVNKYITEGHCTENCRVPAKRPCVPDKLINYLKFLETEDPKMPQY